MISKNHIAVLFADRACCKCGNKVPENVEIIHKEYFDEKKCGYVDEYYCPECYDGVIDEMIKDDQKSIDCYQRAIAKLNGLKKQKGVEIECSNFKEEI